MVRPRCIILLLAALLLGGCSTPTTPAPATVPAHQDPEIWRPKNPVYPMPQ